VKVLGVRFIQLHLLAMTYASMLTFNVDWIFFARCFQEWLRFYKKKSSKKKQLNPHIHVQ
jgi:hypothetical protein